MKRDCLISVFCLLTTNSVCHRSPHSIQQTWSPHSIQQTWSPHSIQQTWSPHSIQQTWSPHSIQQRWSPHSIQQTWSPHSDMEPTYSIVAKSHCFTVRLKILDVVSHQTLIISLQNWVKGSLILMTFITANCKSDCTKFVCGVQVERLLVS